MGRLTVRAAPLPPPVFERGPCRSNGRRFFPPRAHSCAEDVSCGRAQQGRERGQVARERGTLHEIGPFHWYNTSIKGHLTGETGHGSVRASWSPRGLRALNRSHGRWGLNGGKWGREGRHAGGEGQAGVCTVDVIECTRAYPAVEGSQDGPQSPGPAGRARRPSKSRERLGWLAGVGSDPPRPVEAAGRPPAAGGSPEGGYRPHGRPPPVGPRGGARC